MSYFGGVSSKSGFRKDKIGNVHLKKQIQGPCSGPLPETNRHVFTRKDGIPEGKDCLPIINFFRWILVLGRLVYFGVASHNKPYKYIIIYIYILTFI